jgi:uncharacterized protein
MSGAVVEPTQPRMLPPLTAVNRPFWTGGAAGELLIQRCLACRRWTHPPTDRCPTCGGEVAPEAVSGEGTVFTFTVNMHQFHPDVTPPNTIAIVALIEQDDLRIPTNVIDCSEDQLRCGLPVRVLFERHGEIYYPIFRPTGTTS